MPATALHVTAAQGEYWSASCWGGYPRERPQLEWCFVNYMMGFLNQEPVRRPGNTFLFWKGDVSDDLPKGRQSFKRKMWAICISNLRREVAARLSLQYVLKVGAWPPPLWFSVKKISLTTPQNGGLNTPPLERDGGSFLKSFHFSPSFSPRKTTLRFSKANKCFITMRTLPEHIFPHMETRLWVRN